MATSMTAAAGFSAASAAQAEPKALPKVGLCQMMVSADKDANIKEARRIIKAAAAEGADLISLPEIWNSPYATSSFPIYAEEIPVDAAHLDASKSPSTAMLIATARELKVFLVGGSIPEECDGKVYNTCIVVSPEGEIVAKHRKVHLFDIDVPGKITFKESDTLTAGNETTTFDTPFGKIGVAICYDIRFPELSMLMRNEGCELLIFPGAFNMTTGPAHWELLARARAVDNQLYVAMVSPARDPDSAYQAWGHSTLISPWGEVVATIEHDAGVVVGELDMGRVHEIRESIPVSKQKRTDIYEFKSAL
jgi:omega-amidase